MGIIERIKLLDNLTTNEEAVREYVLAHPSRVVSLERSEFLAETHVSKSVLYRFCKKIGVAGYDEMRIELAQSLLRRLDDQQQPNFDFPFDADTSLQGICQSIASVYQQSIKLTLQSLDLSELDAAVTYLRRSKTICLFMPNQTNEMAQGFLERLKDFDRKVKISSSPYDWKVDAYNLTSDDVVIINSYAGSSSDVFFSVIPQLKRKHVPIILIASTHNQKFLPYATCKLLICDEEHPIDKLYSYSSNISIQFVFDVLYSALYQDNYERNYSRRKYVYEVG
jgi:DNA-binding MurR/RpiR family transcriptional regulator